MDDLDPSSPTAAELAAAEAKLPEWDRLRVRDYWDAVCAEELGAPPPHTDPETPAQEPTPESGEVRTLFPPHSDRCGATVDDGEAA